MSRNRAKEGRHYRFHGVEFWASDGLVKILDLEKAGNSGVAPDEAVKTISPADLIKRVIAVRQFVGDGYADEVFEARQLLDNAVECAKAAKRMGDPSDPRVMEHFSKHRRRSSGLILSPTMLPPIGANIPYKLDPQDPRQTLLHGVQVTPDIIIPQR